MKRGAAIAEIALGIGIAALGAFLLYETGEIRVSPVYAKVGPRVIPNLVGGIMAALGLMLAWQSWRALHATPSSAQMPGQAEEDRTDWLPIGAIALGLVQQVWLF